jgi:hypothetical protein
MNLGNQPLVLSILTQVEEILIARVSPLLQVIHARCGQYQYSGHPISFPKNSNTIVNYLPCHLEDLDILVVRRHVIDGKSYECYMTKSHVMNV